MQKLCSSAILSLICEDLRLYALTLAEITNIFNKVCQTAYGKNPTWWTTTHTHTFNGPLSGSTRVSRYQKGKTNLDFTEARDSEWQCHQLGHMLVCTSLQTDNHASTPPLSFLQAICPSCRPTNSVKAMKVNTWWTTTF